MCRKAHSFATVMLSLVMTFAMIAAPLYLPAAAEQSTASAAVNLTDIASHWAKSYIQKAVDKGIVSGYDDNTFRPDKNVTRAEFVKMINGTLGNTGTILPAFDDVSSDMWFYTDVAKGVAACYISGYGDGSFGPDNTITRQEAAVLLSRIVPAAGVRASLDSYIDSGEIAPWARTAMEKMVGKRYMTGDGNLMTPTACLTRGMAAKLVIELSEGESIITNNQTINRDAVTIENVIYANQLSVGTQVGSGTAVVKNSTILGNLNVIGGGGEGEKGVYIQNARIAKMTVNRTDETVQIFTEGESTVVNSYIKESASLIESNTSGINGDFGKGFVNVYMGRKTDLNLNGDLELLEMQDVKCDAIAESNCTINHLIVDSNAERCDITLGKLSGIGIADINGSGAAFHGRGSVETLHVNADSLTYTTVPRVLTVSESVKIQPIRILDPAIFLTITVDPEDGDTGVAVDGNIELIFSSAVHAAGSGSETITAEEAASLISLRKDSPSGSEVPVKATVNNSGTGVTLDPQGTLAHGTDYFVVIREGALTDQYGNVNEALESSFTTEGSQSSEYAALDTLSAGIVNGSTISYSEMYTDGRANSFYVGTDSEVIRIKASSPTPNHVITATYNATTKTYDEDQGYLSFSIISGNTDPGEILLHVSSLDGDYAEQTYTIDLVRILPGIASAVIPLRGDTEESLTMYNSVSAASSVTGGSVSFNSVAGETAYMTVTPAETENPSAVEVAVQKYDEVSRTYTDVQAYEEVDSYWILAQRGAFSQGSGIYRITLTSRIGGNTPANGPITRTTTKFVKVTFTA